MSIESSSSFVTINPEMLERIKFSPHKERIEHHNESVTLTNGDSLPCKILGLSEQKLEIETQFAGSFLIPQEQIKSLSFQNVLESMIYQGPSSPNDWGHLSNWKIKDQSLQTANNAEASIQLPLPTNFSMGFVAQWEGDRPKFKLYLCADAQRIADIKSGYLIDFNTSNIQFYRSTPSRMNQRIGEIPIRLKETSKRSAQVEITVDRGLQEISIHIDGKKLGTFDDTEISPPMGKWTLFEANMRNENLALSEIHFTESDNNFFTGKEANDQTNPELDTLYDKEGISCAGMLLDIIKSDETAVLHIQDKDSDTPISIPLSQAHTVYLAHPNTEETKPANYIAELQDGGTLQFLDLILNEDTALSTHAILGEIELSRTSFSSLIKKSPPHEK